jgi:ribose-phosphate pyrophosphokinase
MSLEPNPALFNVVVVAGSAHPSLAAAVARELGSTPGQSTLLRFPDGETHVEVEARDLEGRDVVVVQPTSKPPGENVFELLLLSDACRHAGAATVTAVVPYFGYARQDRRKTAGEALGARVAAKLVGLARFDAVITVDLHGATAEASLDVPTEHLSAVPVLARALDKLQPRDAVVVAPDLGAARMAHDYARSLRLPMAVVHKLRKSATDVSVEHVAGDVRGLRPIIVDDIIATGGTILATARALRELGAASDAIVVATHGVWAPGAFDRLHGDGLKRIFVTDTIAPVHVDPSVNVVSVAPMLAACVRRLVMRRRGAQLLMHH